MSTNGTLLRLLPNGEVSGTHNHWDSYPSHLGMALWQLYNITFKKDVEALLKAVVDEHPAGWSFVWERCYCHTNFKDPLTSITAEIWPITTKGELEYNYVIDPSTLTVTVYSSKERVLLTFQLDSPAEPDWTIPADRW